MIYFNPETKGSNTKDVPQTVEKIDDHVSTPATHDGTGLTFSISEFSSARDNSPRSKVHTWDTFCTAFSVHHVSASKDGPAWSPASYAEGQTRKNDNVHSVSMAVIDVDNGTPVDDLLKRLEGFAALVHSSYSHTAALPKYRVVVPLSTPVSAENWPSFWLQLNEKLRGCIDVATKDPARLYFKPAHPAGSTEHFAKTQEGSLLVPSELPPLAIEQPLRFHRTASKSQLLAIEGIESEDADLQFEQGLKHVVSRCAFMEAAASPSNQDGLPEPLWMAMISNACRFENSGGWIHAASEHHGQYSEEETSNRISRYRNSSAPVTCARIQELGFTGCPSGGCRTANGQVTKAPAGLYGWMFKQQLTVAETDATALPESYVVGEFSVNPEGVFQRKMIKDEERLIRLSSRIDVVALTRDHDSSNWGLQLRFNDPDNVAKSWALPRELLANNGESYRGSLLKLGASVEPSKAARDGLAEYLVTAMPEARALSVRQPGWFGSLFVLPNKVYGRSEERVVFQTSDPDEMKRFTEAGTLESWQGHITRPCQGNSRAVASICIGLAPPLLALLGEDNGGFHLRGNSSIGKSVCLFLGSSVWGGSALIRTWNMTVNGLEGVATMHNDVLLPLDELGQADGKAAGDAAYMLGNGQGKSRSNRDGDARAAKRFRNLVLSSGEKSLSDLIAQTGQKAMAGQEVRMVEIAADAGCNYGVFEDIHDAKSSQVFAETLKQAVTQHHGHAGRAFVGFLADPALQPQLIAKLKSLIQQFVDANVADDAAGQVGRVARRFGLIAAAGELCIELGILPWPVGEAMDASRKCFQSWIEQRGGAGNQEAVQAIAQVRRFLESHGESRFTPFVDGIDNNGLGKTMYRAGFREVMSDGRTDFYVLPEAFRNDVCAGLNPRQVTKLLVDERYLATNNQGKPQVEKTIPGLGKIRVYHITADLFSAANLTI